ncbi:MAG TPA: cell wall metabolism sensor histidine kinase WalK [Firmicutes bacterium]|nr:cell wall metabolism sensor histidine kinase WalK [Bacillota bacterium]
MIYLLLLLLAVEVTGGYLLQALEHYYLRGFAAAVDAQGQLVAGFLERYLAPEPDREYVQRLVNQFATQSGDEIAVLSSSGELVAYSSGSAVGGQPHILQAEVARALAGGRAESVRLNPGTKQRQLHLARPIRSGDRVLGAVYIASSLESTYRVLGDIRRILLVATSLALASTAVLGYVLSLSITRPIREVTGKAGLMAAGDFSQRISVLSRDEIGQLGEMFNHLTARLAQTLDEIRAEKGKLEAVLTYMAEGLLATDSTGRLVLLNPAGGRLLGLSAEAVGKPLDEVWPGLLPEGGMETVVGSGATEKLVTAGERKLHAYYAPLELGGAGRGLVVVVRDVTQELRLQEMRRDFVANVSHELRTPLATIQGYVETLLEGALEDPQVCSRFLQTVQREAERMTALVGDLLLLSQLEHGQASWQMEPLDLQEPARQAVERLRPVAEKKGLQLELVSEPGVLLLVNGDEPRLVQVFTNLISNAVEFTPPGGRVTVRLRAGYLPSPDPGTPRVGASPGPEAPRAVASVEDTGVGIPVEDLPRVFERFYRVDKGRSRELGGTGLGLSIAQEIVQAHGGEISLVSETGKGTTVSFWIPLAPEEGDGVDR